VITLTEYIEPDREMGPEIACACDEQRLLATLGSRSLPEFIVCRANLAVPQRSLWFGLSAR
jgi:hypothetical protein